MIVNKPFLVYQAKKCIILSLDESIVYKKHKQQSNGRICIFRNCIIHYNSRLEITNVQHLYNLINHGTI